MPNDDVRLFRAIRRFGDNATLAALAEEMGLSEESLLALIERNECRLRWDGETYSLTEDAETALHNDDASPHSDA